MSDSDASLHNRLAPELLERLVDETRDGWAQGALVLESLILGFVMLHENLQSKPGSVLLDALYDGVQRRLESLRES